FGVLPADADVAATDPSILDQPARDILGGVDGDGETNALRGQNHHRIHADDFAARVDERPAGVARIQCRVRLDDVVHQPAGIGTERPPKGADHSGSDRAFETVRIANGDGELADADVLRFTQARGGEVGRVNAEDGEVGVRILANQLRVGPSAIAEDHFDSVGAVNDVAVGQNKSVGTDDEARTA